MDGEGKTEITSIFLVRNQSDSCLSCSYIATKSYIISLLSFLDLSFYLKFVSGNCTQFVFVRFFLCAYAHYPIDGLAAVKRISSQVQYFRGASIRLLSDVDHVQSSKTN